MVHLVNLSPVNERHLLVQAGGFGEHAFTSVRYEASRTGDYPGAQTAYAAPPVQTETVTTPVDDKHTRVVMPPAREIVLDLGMKRYANRPTYALPWAGSTG